MVVETEMAGEEVAKSETAGTEIPAEVMATSLPVLRALRC